MTVINDDVLIYNFLSSNQRSALFSAVLPHYRYCFGCETLVNVFHHDFDVMFYNHSGVCNSCNSVEVKDV